MKRALLENVRVMPYASNTVIDRAGFLSAVFGAKAAETGTVSLVITHCDTEDGTFVTVEDAYISVGNPVTNLPIEEGGILNVDIDLIACKRYVKVSTSGAEATYAVALGDAETQPV